MLIVTIPVYNEREFLKETVQVLLRQTAALREDYRLIIAEDGSTDGSDTIARSLEAANPHIIHVHEAKKLGKGLALKKAWKQVEGDIYVFVDADLATDMKYFPTLVDAIKNGFDIAIGSRYKKGARVRRPTILHIASRIYNVIVRVAFRTNIYDHQIGFKAFSKKLVSDLVYSSETADWFWDTEILVRSRRKGYKCLEFPVEWQEKRERRTPIRRLVKDIYTHGKDLIQLQRSVSKPRMRWRLHSTKATLPAD